MKPFKEAGLICERDGFLAKANVDHDIMYHSPAGFEWGYGGSGPSELALNVMNQVLPIGCDEQEPVTMGGEKVSWAAHRLYQRFKWEFIEEIPPEGGHIPLGDICAWVEEQLGVSGETS